MEFLTNNLNVLKDAIDKAKKKIYICSAWIRSEILKKIFDDRWFIKHENNLPEIRFLIRMGSSSDFSITDVGNFLKSRLCQQFCVKILLTFFRLIKESRIIQI